MFLLPRCLVSRDQGRDVSARDIRSDGLGGQNLSQAKLNPTMTFIYVSGAGTDSTVRGRSMWARVKRRTENALLQMPFKAVCLSLLSGCFCDLRDPHFC